MACIPIKTVKIAREPGTSLSRGLCYVEANNVSEASRLFSTLTQEVLEIDGRIGKLFSRHLLASKLLASINLILYAFVFSLSCLR